MPLTDPAFWTEEFRRTLRRYDVSLLRQVCERLLKPRGQWPAEELIERSVRAVGNLAALDRCLQGLPPAGRRLLALIGHSRQPRWKLVNLVELLATLDRSSGTQQVLALLAEGLLFPEISRKEARLKSFQNWFVQDDPGGPAVMAHPNVALRALGEDLDLPDLSANVCPLSETIQEADGLEFPLRLAVLWQQAAAAPLKRTRQGDFFKRDLDRLRGDPLLTSPPADSMAQLPDAGLLAVELALVEGLLTETEGELTPAAALPSSWDQGLPSTLASLWAALPLLKSWDSQAGWRGGKAASSPYPPAQLLALLLLARLPEPAWTYPEAVEQWLVTRHPFWSEGETSASLDVFLLGFAYQLRMLQAAKDPKGNRLIRLSAMGRWLLGVASAPAATSSYPQTLLVQPNLEIIAYRQGLTPALIARLSGFAAWKGLGSACTLQLQPETVYRALETGHTFESIQQTLEQHGARTLPPAVLAALKTWSNKRERLGVYPAATVFEFASAAELNEALARGLAGTRLSERLLAITEEAAVDFRHFRLTGMRDYGLAPEACVEVGADGVTLRIDLAKSDLLLETELVRFAEPCPRPAGGHLEYRLTPASLASARQSGLGPASLEKWFLQRTGQPLTAAARLLLSGRQTPPLVLSRLLVLEVSAAETADGLMQWPSTRALIQARLGPTALAVAEENVEELRQRLATLGLSVQAVGDAGQPSSLYKGDRGGVA